MRALRSNARGTASLHSESGAALLWLAWRTAIPLAATLAACAPVRGYPDNPSDEAAVMTSLQPYLSPDAEAHYETLQGTERESYRNAVVVNRMRAHEIAFGDFERRLWGDSNIISAGGDLLVLALSGLGATIGSTATGSALAAASAGIVGGQAAVNKDLYYQRTMPALLAQMEANRDRIKLTIINGLKQPDSQYTLYQADLDLDALQRASGIPGAVGDITQQATTSKADAQKELQAQSLVTAVSPDLQARKTKFDAYVRALASSKKPEDAKTLDATAAALSVPLGTNKADEGASIIFNVATSIKTSQDMDKLSALLAPITKKEF